MSVSPPARVLNLLRMGHPLSKVEAWTGWPAGSIRRLATKQGWQFDHRGRSFDPNEVRLPNWPRITPEEARELFTRLQERRAQLGMTWVQVAIAMGVATDALPKLNRGTGTTHTRDQAEAWLTKTSTFIPTNERQPV
ncbi:hypothetical protein [Microbispora sp. NPDC049633]|uniref:hypothetical protein n=1 Tax=Microbispora sp. NPDC049633 TaxID=3154355 RepID=UPI00344798DB